MLPQILIDNALFCCWRREERNGQMTKVPYDPKTGERARANDPSTFSDYEEAVWKAHAFSCNGVGIYIGRGFSAIDIDHCFDGNGELTELAMDIITTMDSYTETSPSGSGIRILFRSDLQYDKEKYYIKNPNNGLEVYVEGATSRFVTVTGKSLSETPQDIYERTEQLQTVLDKYMLRPVKTRSGRRTATQRKKYTMTDDQIIAKACREERFEALFLHGDMTYYNNDQSSADLALCNKLAFWCGCDKGQMDRIFRRSALMRDKWDSPREQSTYGDITMQRAIDDCDSVYEAGAYDRNVFDRLDLPHLDTGDWDLTMLGVSRREENARKGEFKTYIASTTPVAPAMLLENLDTGVHKTELRFLAPDGKQRSIIADNETIGSRNRIISLANAGIGVTSTTATELVNFLQAAVNLNRDKLPVCTAVSRLGWVGDKFVPYDTDVKFDGELADRKLFRAISSSGTLEEWVDFVQPLRENIPLRLAMAASFASPLIQRCGALPFVFHLWGKTGGGKTVALKVAMSVWGRPALGDLMYTMNMTDNAMMNTAGFLYSLPFAGDELQLIQSNYGYDRLIMRITEGVDRGRMKYDAKIAQKTWRNAFIFTGEEPCTGDSSGGGARNRVIEVCTNGLNLVGDGGKVAGFVDAHYGCAGPAFIDYVRANDPKPYYDSYFHVLIHSCDATDKQAMAAAMLLTGDELARQCLFPSERPLTVDDIEPFIKGDEEVDVSIRAQQFIEEWIAVNQNSFSSDSKQVFGRVEGDHVFVICHVLKSALQDAGFSFDAVKADWANRGFLKKYGNKFVKRVRVNSALTYCVELAPVSTCST